MAAITAIEQQKKRKERFNIYIDGEFAFAATAETIFKDHLKSGTEISQTAIERLVKENEFGLLLDRTLRWITQRPHSEKELRYYLNRPNPKRTTPRSETAIAQVIKRITKLGYVNDYEFAKWFVQSRMRSRPRGKQLLRAELYKKGIDRDIIDAVLDEMFTIDVVDGEQPQSEEDLALRAAEKKLSTYRRYDEQAFKQKLVAYLARRGFSWEIIRPVLDQMVKER